MLSLHCGRGPSLLLLGALLLFVAGAVLDPFVHAMAGGAADGPHVVEACADEPDPTPASPAGEDDCVTCTLSRTVAFVAPAWTADMGDEVASGSPVSSTTHSRAPPVRSALQPRAPPLP
jgi:hypothetical protein